MQRTSLYHKLCMWQADLNQIEDQRLADSSEHKHSRCRLAVFVLAGVWCVSAWLTHRLETVTLCLHNSQSWVSNAQDTDRRLFFSLSYFRFRTSVSVLQHLPPFLWSSGHKYLSLTKIFVKGHLKDHSLADLSCSYIFCLTFCEPMHDACIVHQCSWLVLS